MRATMRFVLTAILFALGTWILPWPVVPVLAALLVLVAPRICTPGLLALAAAGAWGGMLGWTALHAPLGVLAAELGGILHAPAAVVIALGPAIAAALAWAGAEVARAVQVRGRSVTIWPFSFSKTTRRISPRAAARGSAPRG